MKRKDVSMFFIFLCCLSIIGCASTPTAAPEQPAEKVTWSPESTGDANVLYMPPATLYSMEKADAIIQNMQPQIISIVNGYDAKAESVAVDKEAIKIKWKWAETVMETTQSQGKTAGGKGFSLGTKKADIISNLLTLGDDDEKTVQTHTTSKQIEKGDSTIIPFEDISSIYNSEGADIGFAMKGGEEYVVSIQNEYNRRKWMDAVYSAMRARGYDTKVILGLIYQESDLTPEQKSDSTVQKGVVIQGTASGSPASKAGFKYLDIIQSVNGIRVNTVTDFKNSIRNLNLRRGKTFTVEVIRWNRNAAKVNKQSLALNVAI